jgi:hypothetical protein
MARYLRIRVRIDDIDPKDYDKVATIRQQTETLGIKYPNAVQVSIKGRMGR